jgi:hypothetical protein
MHDALNPEIVHAASIPQVKPEDLIRALDADDPTIRAAARRDLIKLGSSAAPYIEHALTDPAGSYRLRVGVLSALKDMNEAVRKALSEPARCVIGKAATGSDSILRAEAKAVIAAGVIIPADCMTIHDSLLKDVEPAALAHLASGTLVLDAFRHRLLRINSEGITIFADLGGGNVVDMAASELSSRAADACVILNPPAGGAGRLVQYVNGVRLPRVWSPLEPQYPQFSGIAVDNQQKIAYLARATQDTFCLYKLGLEDGAHANLEEVARWHDPKHPRAIGPIVVDGNHRVLFAADTTSGELYRVDLTHTKNLQPLKLKDSQGHPYDSLPETPLAITLDGSGNTLYAAAGKHLWAAHLEADPVRFNEPWQSTPFAALSAVAVDSDGNVWAGDQHNHAVYVLSSSGKVLRIYQY